MLMEEFNLSDSTDFDDEQNQLVGDADPH